MASTPEPGSAATDETSSPEGGTAYRTEADSTPDGSFDQRVSVADADGNAARFAMAYTPRAGERIPFGPPLRNRLPAYLYLAFACVMSALAYVGYGSSPSSPLYKLVVEGDRTRPMTAAGLTLLLIVSAVATVVRSHMRGIVVRADGLEARYLLPLGIPRVRRWTWAQLCRLVLGRGTITLELWDGSYERLPDVADEKRLENLLCAIAATHHIRITGPT